MDWCNDRDPDMDSNGFFHTCCPIINYQMMPVSDMISLELGYKVLPIDIEQVTI